MSKTNLAKFAATVGKRLPRQPPGVDPWIRDRATWLLFAMFGLVLAVVLGLGFRHEKPQSPPARLGTIAGQQAEAAETRPEETATRPRTIPAAVPGDGLMRPAQASTPTALAVDVYKRVFGEQDAIEAELADVLNRSAAQLPSEQIAIIRLLRRLCSTGQFLQELTAARTVGTLPDGLQRRVLQLSQRWIATELVVSERERQRQVLSVEGTDGVRRYNEEEARP